MHLTGVLSVTSFHEDSAEFETLSGFCQITGKDLHMEKLDLEEGEVLLEGEVVSIYYPPNAQDKGKSLFQRLFS